MGTFDIVMFNMSSYSEWQRGVSNRNHHVLSEIAKNQSVGTVLAVDYPPLTLKRAIRNYRENFLMTPVKGAVLKRSMTDRLVRISDRLCVYSNVAFFARPERFVAQLRDAIRALGLGNFIIWSFFPPVMPYVNDLGQKLTVFDAVDNWAEHSSYRPFRERLRGNYEFIKQHADVIFAVSEDLQKLFDNQHNVHWIPNGVDLAHYQREHRIINRDIADIPHPIVGYIGVVQDRVDIGLIKFLAQKNPTKSFVIVGPVWDADDESSLKELPNIHVLGYKTYEEAPAYIQQFDVGVIPHKQSSFITSTNPMKMYEYLACGKPVVALKGTGAEMLQGTVYLAKNAEDFNRKLFLALEEDTPQRRAARVETASRFTWTAATQQMIEIVKKRLPY